jgi:phage shock protein A
MSLRAKAKQEGGEMVEYFQQSHDAYERGKHALANALSEEGRRHEHTMEALNAEASAWIFRGIPNYPCVTFWLGV